MPFDFDTPKTFFEKCAKAVDWVAEEIIRQKNWRSLLVLIDVALFLAFNPFEWPFANLLSLFPQLRQFGWYAPAFWSLTCVIFAIAVIVAARAKRKAAEHAELKLGAIKGLLPFGYEDAGVFSHLQRDQNLKECLQAIGDEQWRFGVLSGESGAGKTSFLQAGLWPELEKRKLRCVYVKFSDLDPFESVKRACLKHLSFAEGAPDGADLQGLFRAAAAQDRTPVVLFFDQFEQFFVHRKRKKDREPFAQALAQWFAEAQSLPIKILICVRGDFFDRLNELQKAMRYSLSPTQSFRLERFEPDQATEVFCFLAEKEGLEYDRKFISEMTRQELADAEDGLISPVDIQVLARMIERQTTQGARAFDRATFQKLGGVEGLLERYMTTALEPLVTQSRRQAAIKVLLALTDLERNARAGALTFEDLRRKLDDIADSELKDAVAYLLLGDVRLISPLSENEEEKFELAHERLIPALRRMAGKQLSLADRADQLLDRRTNEWLGNERASRYLFSRSELRLINKHRRFVTWGKQRQAKEELLAASRRRFRLWYAAAGLASMLALIGWIWLNTNAGQTYLIKRELRDYSASLDDVRALSDVATAFAYAGDSQLTLQVIDRISNINNIGKDSALSFIDKDSSLSFIVKSCAELGEANKDISLLSNAIKITERINGDTDKEIALREIVSSIVRLGETTNGKNLLPDVIKSAERINKNDNKSITLSAIASAYATLGDKERANALLSDAIETVERISNPSSKAFALGSIAVSYARMADKEKATALFSEAIETAERISGHPSNPNDLSSYFESKGRALNKIVFFIAKLGESLKDGALMSEAIEVVRRIDDDSIKAFALMEVAGSYINLGDKEKVGVLLSAAIETAERISGDRSYAGILQSIAHYYAKLGDATKDKAPLSEALKLADRISDDRLKNAILREIAESYADLGDKEKAISLLSTALKSAKELSDGRANAQSAIAESYARIGSTMNDSSLLLEAVKAAEQISDDYYKARALRSIIKYSAKLAESSNDRAFYDETFRYMEGRSDDEKRNLVLEGILSSKLAIADVRRLRLLTSHYKSTAGKAIALALILKARSHPELIRK
jgi:tetratricopeptide (TPR) repeat protein